mgnify:CR=1 FL=1|jgi:hypothetical protein|tara:strand:+ start:1343 stop:2347 length:1005 start_codon:yes stop_codon:yes gene_type:complete
MKNTIYVLEGSYRKTSVENQTFQLVKGYQPHPHKEGGFITVKIEDLAKYPGATKKQIRINVENENQLRDSAPEQPKEESDAETVERMRQRFNILTDMTKATKRGDVRAMIVSGPPGVGKSFGVEQVLDRYGVVSTLGNTRPKYEVVKGAMSSIGLYCKLYNFSDPDNVLVFDDCDSILLDDLSLNILKAALDSKKTRKICWNTDSHTLRREGVPDTFNFAGSVIFITNIKFDNVRSKKLRDHLEALESRCHYIDLTIDTIREKILRIKQIVTDGMLKSYALPSETEQSIVAFIDEYKRQLREISLRTVLKIADLAKAFPENWKDVAKQTVLKPV